MSASMPSAMMGAQAARGIADSTIATMTARASRKAVAAAVAGNALELFDFLTYVFFAVYIGKAFFPASTPLTSLLLSLAAFGVGFASRPIGAILMGAYADRAGRKPALLLSMGLITLSTLGLALTPTFETIGMAAPVIVVVCRLAQGLAYGGEFGPASAFLLEIAPPGRRGFYSSWQFASQGIASIMAGGFGVALVSLLTPDELQAWGWRLPFAFGLLMIPIAVVLRRSMPETLGHRHEADNGLAVPKLRQHGRLLALFLLLILGGTVSTYVGSYMTTYAIVVLKLSPAVAMASAIVVGFTILVFSLLGGWLSDRFGRKVVMLIPRALSVLLAYPAFMFLIEQRTTAALLGVSALLAALNSISNAAALVTILELLPRSVRALGSSIAYATGVALFGGTTQFVVTWLIDATGDPAAPAWYVALTSAIATVAILALPECRDRTLPR
ncbi:MAG: MFS transporter [Rhodoferax sp.]|uniref:MFS transporter n=1 Tax=Rhodoferax sp. TaxID=50421 RepID=UPI00182D4A56|nr:MFS transporter [Rhodoferax sp.]NMM14954.1 MFS transporter [Rhodoferax sp.]